MPGQFLFLKTPARTCHLVAAIQTKAMHRSEQWILGIELEVVVRVPKLWGPPIHQKTM